MNSTATVILLVLSSLCCSAQQEEMLAQGTVRDARTNKGVKAHIRYSSIPTGSIYGKFSDSTFSFVIFGTARYEVTAEAPGYVSRTIVVDPKQMDRNHRVNRDIKLLPAGETIRLNHLIFAQGKSAIDSTSFDELNQIAAMLNEYRNVVIQLEGHTDNLGAPEANLRLSQDRVDAVKNYLVNKGIDRGRIKTKAFGGSQPLRTDPSPDARAMNRRVEMRILRD